MRIVDSKTALKALQQQLDARRQSRIERVVIDFYEWKKKRRARAVRERRRPTQWAGFREEGKPGSEL